MKIYEVHYRRLKTLHASLCRHRSWTSGPWIRRSTVNTKNICFNRHWFLYSEQTEIGKLRRTRITHDCRQFRVVASKGLPGIMAQKASFLWIYPTMQSTHAHLGKEMLAYDQLRKSDIQFLLHLPKINSMQNWKGSTDYKLVARIASNQRLQSISLGKGWSAKFARKTLVHAETGWP